MDSEFRAYLDMPDPEPVRKVRRKRYNSFGWAIFLLLLVGFGLASWIGSFYVFSHPEDPRCYAILQALNKAEPLKRFEVTAAPVGTFFGAKELYDAYLTMSDTMLEQKNGDLLRNYLRNYADTKTPVPYLAGHFKAVGVYELKASDMFPSGVVAVAESVDCPQVMIEHIYSTESSNIPKVRRMLAMNPDIILAKTFDLSAVVHAEKLDDAKILFTVIPLGYGNYAYKQGISSTFRLDPPRVVNLEGGMPVIKPGNMDDAVKMFAQYRKSKGMLAQIKTPAFPDPTPQTVARSAGPAITPPPVEIQPTPEPEPVAVVASATPVPEVPSAPEPVVAAEQPAPPNTAPVPSAAEVPASPSVASTVAVAQPPANSLVPAELPQVMMNPSRQNQPAVPVVTSQPVATPAAVVQSVVPQPQTQKIIAQPQPQKIVFQKSTPALAALTPPAVRPVAHVSPSPNLSHIIAAMHSPTPKAKAPVYAIATPSPARSLPVATPSVTRAIASLPTQPQPVQITPAQPQQYSSSPNGVKLEPFMAAPPRQVEPPAQAAATNLWRTYPPGQMPRGKLLDWQNVPELAETGINQRFYIRGKYIVTASSANRLVLRPQGYAGEPVSTVRLVVEFPAGAQMPPEGSAVARGEMRPFQIVEVRRGNDGQVNVYAREVTTPWQVTNTADLLRSYHQQRERLANQYLQ